VILLERNAEIGGFIATEERTLPGYLHDTFSSWHPLFVSGPAYAALGELPALNVPRGFCHISGFYLLLLSSRREPGYAIPMP
jgi:phytoene dehydrogenase-like protein